MSLHLGGELHLVPGSILRSIAFSQVRWLKRKEPTEVDEYTLGPAKILCEWILKVNKSPKKYNGDVLLLPFHGLKFKQAHIISIFKSIYGLYPLKKHGICQEAFQKGK